MCRRVQLLSKDQEIKGMKERFLNLNSVGGKFLTAIAVLLIGIPGCGCILARLGLHGAKLDWMIRASLWAGAALLLVFILLIIIEQGLDTRLFHQYRMTRNRRIPLPNGYAECPCCGFRGIRDFETVCAVCKKELL
jgi:hypothetical protein